MRQLLIGGNGLLGAGFTVAAPNELERPAARIPWADTEAATRTVIEEVVNFVARRPDGRWRLIWAAGVGRVGSPPDLLAQETTILDSLCRALIDSGATERGQVVFGSSAGALFGGFGDGLIREDSQPKPNSSYGQHKLDQEEIVAQLGDHGCSVLLCRISNLFGLRGDGRLGSGLVNAAIRSTMGGLPLTIFVSPDCRRDYLFNRDAAAMALSLAAEVSSGVHVRLVCSGTTRSVAEVTEVVGSVLRRRVPMVFSVQPETFLQPKTLNLERPRSLPATGISPFPHAIAITARGHLRDLAAGAGGRITRQQSKSHQVPGSR